MAEMEFSRNKEKRTNAASKKSTRIDLTPMVDLGFLLITFFVFTTTMSRQSVMKVEMPFDTEPGDDICNSCALTVLPGKNDVIHYYEGKLQQATLQTTNYGAIRNIIQQKQQEVGKIRGNRDAFVLIIKAADESSFKNFVDITDEVTINGIRRYYIDELTAEEKRQVEQAPF